MPRYDSFDGCRGVAWANSFARALPIACTGKLPLTQTTHQITCVGPLEAAHEGKDGGGLFSTEDGKSEASLSAGNAQAGGSAEIQGMALACLPDRL